MNVEQKRALVVDHEYLSGERVVSGLKSEGFEVNQLKSADDAQFQLLEESPDIDLAVVRFPSYKSEHSDVHELLEVLNERGIPILLTSTFFPDDLEKVCSENQYGKHLELPYSEKDLKETIEALTKER